MQEEPNVLGAQVPNVFDPPEERRDELWISDGNVVLSAVNVVSWIEHTVLFCVHRSSLVKRFEVFASMFDPPRTEEEGAAGNYEGLPLVRMPDSAEEVEALVLLNAFYDPYPLFERSPRSETPPSLRVRKALHMASKYLTGGLRDKLTSTGVDENEWPLRLKVMDERDHMHMLEDIPDNFSVYSDSEWPAHFKPEPAAAISLAEN